MTGPRSLRQKKCAMQATPACLASKIVMAILPFRPRAQPRTPTMTLIEAVRATIRRLHYSPRTEEAYVHWIREFVGFHGRRHPREMGAAEITAFLNDLAVKRCTSAST